MSIERIDSEPAALDDIEMSLDDWEKVRRDRAWYGCAFIEVEGKKGRHIPALEVRLDPNGDPRYTL